MFIGYKYLVDSKQDFQNKSNYNYKIDSIIIIKLMQLKNCKINQILQNWNSAMSVILLLKVFKTILKIFLFNLKKKTFSLLEALYRILLVFLNLFYTYICLSGLSHNNLESSIKSRIHKLEKILCQNGQNKIVNSNYIV